MLVTMAYDKAKWHSGGDFPEGLSPENGGTHIGMFLAWAVIHGMAGEELIEDAGAQLDAVRGRRMTGRELLFTQLDGVLSEDDLNEEGNAFAAHYYRSYMGDYDRLMRTRYATAYHADDDWSNYDQVAGMIEKRYHEWKAKRGGSTSE
jgi:hypothetical protein